MQDFFTNVQTVDPQFTGMTLLLLNLMLYLAALFTILYMRRERNHRPFLVTLALLQLFEFVSVNSWYWIVGYMAFPLPLYHCRLAKLFLIFLVLSKTESKLRSITVYAVPMAVMGAIGAYALPNPDPFDWPHITTVGFFLGHLILMMLGLAVLLDDSKPWTRQDLLRGEAVMLLLNLIITPIARYTEINYSYHLSSPFMKDKFAALSPVVYTLLVYIAYAVVYALTFTLLRLLKQAIRKKAVDQS